MKNNIHKIFLDEVGSTNNYASQLLQHEKPEHEMVVITSFQTDGRGQEGNNWESEAGKNLTLSFILHPEFLQAKWQFMLTKVFSLALVDLLKVLQIKDVCIKWPNDIYVRKSKIAGILIENFVYGSKISSTIVGIGLNINQQKFSKYIPAATSLKLLTDKDFVINEVFEMLLDEVDNRYNQLKKGEVENLNKDYYTNLLGLDVQRKYIYKGETIMATIMGVNDFGELVLHTVNKKIVCGIKEISFVI